MLVADNEQYCELHNQKLVSGNVPVLYGLFRYDNDFLSARVQLFPKSKFLVLGGCVISPDAEFFHQVNYCSVCRENHIEWAKNNNSNAGLAPSEQEHSEYIARRVASMGIPASVPSEVMEYVKSGKISKAIKILKLANPDSDFANLKGYVDMLKKKASIS